MKSEEYWSLLAKETDLFLSKWERIAASPMGGGGALGYLGGCIRSLSKFKNTPKALISGQKSTLILIKR